MIWKKNAYRNPKIYNVTPRRESNFEISPKLIKLVVLLILVGLLIWFLFYSSVFKIKTVDVNGTLNPEVKTEIDNFYGRNILSFRVGKIQNDLAKKQTSIKTLEINRGLPDTLKVQVNVRIPAIGWKTQDKNYYIDDEGVVFELAQGQTIDQNGEKIIVIEDTKNFAINPGEQLVTPAFVNFVKTMIKNVKDNQNIQVTVARIIETTFQIEADTDQGFKIILSTDGNLDNQLKALTAVIKDKRQDIHEYVDLRIEGRVYYK